MAVALIRGFADNCNTLAAEIATSDSTTADEAIAMAHALLGHMLKHWSAIAATPKNVTQAAKGA